MNIGYRLRISGSVQKVGYRSFTYQHAQELGITGWVKNEVDGTVMAEIFGEEAAVQLLIERLQVGPTHAQVREVSAQQIQAPMTPSEFRIIRA